MMVDHYGKAGGRRVEGEIVEQLSPSTFRVKTEAGTVTKRHTKQIIKPLRRSERLENKPNSKI